MEHHASRGRVAAAVAAAVLAGVSTAWLTRPVGSAEPAAAFPTRAVTTPATPVPGDAGAKTSASASPGTSVPPTALPSIRVHPAAPPAGGAGRSRWPAPTALTISGLDLRMKIMPVGIAQDGQMALPTSPADIGWYEYGPRPGEPGATVLAGHLDSPDYGTGPLARLSGIQAGERVTITASGQTTTYAVSSVTRYEKTQLDLAALFRREGADVLHVVTCAGTFDRETRSYDENVVVVARPLR